MPTPSFDYAIIGAGAAGLHLAVQIAAEPALQEKKILILDKDTKESNDRTWSFWEEGRSELDDIATKSWNKVVFYGARERHEIALRNYHYKTIRSADFYQWAKEKIQASGQFTWITDPVEEVKGLEIIGQQATYTAGHIFDSRVPNAFQEQKKNHISLIQHFLGWFIETSEPVFNDQEIIVMDYRLKWKDQTSFNYVLPFSPTTALVEFTLFNETLLQEEEYEDILQQYISETLGIADFTIVEKERGQIPMSTYPFQRHHSKHLTKIGTAGGWVRPSSGYSFKNAERYSRQVVQNLKNGTAPSKGVATNRFRFYDKIFLRVLRERNDMGEEIFQILYTKQSIETLFKFMDEQSTFSEDIKIMFSLDKSIFRKALFQSLFG